MATRRSGFRPRRLRLRLDACTVHAVLTPSRRLRDEVVERCKKIWPANMLLPLGRTEEGDAHFDHTLLLLREQLPGVVAEIQQIEDDLSSTEATDHWRVQQAV